MGSIAQDETFDIIVVGAGFSGLYLLHRFIQEGFSVRLLEAAPRPGGTWYWNCYPGARVDTEVPQYQYTIDETWADWNWKQRFPGRDELVDYFEHVTDVWDLKSHIEYNTRVNGAHWDEQSLQWAVQVNDDPSPRYRSQFLCLCTGFAAKSYTPPFKGLENFRGDLDHTSKWPQGGVALDRKRVGVIGTGASGVQAIQNIAKVASHLTVFQRTPNTCIPMTNPNFDDAKNQYIRDNIPQWREKQFSSYAGFNYDFKPEKGIEASEEERLRTFEDLWSTGGLHFWLGNYSDMLQDKKVNDAAYAFWREKTLPRIKDPRNAEILAPEKPPHPFGAKRISLEQSYFEVFNQSNVDLVDVRAHPITELVPEGVKTADGAVHKLDVLIMATGFDSISGSMLQLDLRGTGRQHITEKWATGVYTNLGMSIHGFPNMFFVYGPQAPTAFATGPISAEVQGAWIVRCTKYLAQNSIRTIEATEEAEKKWREHVNTEGFKGLFAEGHSWWYGENIPGKPREALNYMAGMPAYKRCCSESETQGYSGFVLS
ncbi:hypothetical protein H2202_010629 [Exophiala xenobiotica]|nr:hypothetical protein H2202_010629 [Exophiala xenobiotica]KAK5216076.1 hypothetical protein LTR72_010952 [Exophiala xenobiotica]KAK5285471.1 hypothetical protein LTR14_010867 [Exophiala xenobiotica]KAK5470499.1 hypothetical protein LTR55_010908 [Exophiala xenobiotica]